MNWVKRGTETTIAEVVNRNISGTGLSLEEFLDTEKTYKIYDIPKAISIIKKAVANNEQITIVGDYDADGVDASAIMYLAIKTYGGKVNVRLPRRISEGFGISEKIIDEIPSGLVITVDNGIAGVEPIKKAKEKGLTVIVTDHHLPNEDGILPPADLIIDPNAIPNSADFNGYCGAGIAFKIAEHLIPNNQTMLAKLSCFAAIGTVADVMELTHDNRRIVIEGLHSMTHYCTRTTGLASILKAANLEDAIVAKDIAFTLGPMINAPGRLFDDGAMISFNALVYNGPYQDSIGIKIAEINQNRKELKKEYLKKLNDNIAENCLYGDYPYVIYEPGIPEGIIGLLAGQMAETLQSPCFIFTDSAEPGIYKGSARTYGGVHLKNLLDTCSSLLYRYGGHAEAAGISVEAQNFDELKEKLFENIPEMEEESDSNTLYYDLEIDAKDIPTVMILMKKYEPFGNGNPEIVFKINNFAFSPRYSKWYSILGGDNNIKFFGINMSAVAFGQSEKYMEMGEPHNLNIIGTLSLNYYRHKSETQIECADFQNAAKTVEKTKLSSALKKIAEERYV